MTKHIEQTYKVLDEISHVRQRTGMYAGSTSYQTSEEWVYENNEMTKKSISYIPAFIKIFSEILDNAIDEHKRVPDQLDIIRIEFKDNGYITVQDNGRGIPVEIHSQTGEYIAQTIFSNLRAGSNFNDDEDQSLIGTNGVGSTICSILSEHFKVESCDGKKLLKFEFWNGLREKSEPKITDSNKSGTKVIFKPDYEFFNMEGMNEFHKLKMIKRVVDAAANNPKIKFYINGDRVQIKSFADYVKLYAGDEYVVDITPDWQVGVSASDGYDQISFVNSVETYEGGTHVDYVTIQIVEKLREYFKKKHKIEVKPGELRSHIRVYVSATINRPKFSAQTKGHMISPASEWKTTWRVPDKFIRQITQSSIIQAVLDWVEAKKQADLLAQIRKTNKDTNKADPRRVDKFSDANEKKDRHECLLFLAEGDSARSSIQSARGKNPYIGSFSLRGKPLNVLDAELKDIFENKEIKNILTITGLEVGKKVERIPDKKWIQLEINGEKILVNEVDEVLIDNEWIKVSSLL